MAAILLYAATVAAAAAAMPEAPHFFFRADGTTVPLRWRRSELVVETYSQASPAAVSASARRSLSALKSDLPRTLTADRRLFALALETTAAATAWMAHASQLQADPAIRRIYPSFVHPPGSERVVLNDELVVRLRAGATTQALSELAGRFGLQLLERDRYDSRIAVFRVQRAEPFAALETANAIFRSGAVEWAEPNFVVELKRSFIPNDPRFGWQWNLHNTGQSGGRPGADIDAPEAWNLTLGSPGITIAIVDDGMNIDHPDLRNNVFYNPREIPGNGIDDDGNGYVDDVAGWDFYAQPMDNNPRPDGPADFHSTACAGMAAAVGNNGEGVAGVAPRCRILPVRVLGDANPPVSRVAQAIRYAATLADVISLSWESSVPNDVIGSSLLYAATEGRRGLGCVIVASTGNDGRGDWIGFPASHGSVLGIGASTINDVRATYSNYANGYGVFLLAPSSEAGWGHPVYTLSAAGGYDWFAGTSAAAPEAAGACALILSVSPALPRADVATVLRNTTDKIDPAVAAYDAGGYSHAYGYGRLNLYRAVAEVTPDLAALSFDFQPTWSARGGLLAFSGAVRNVARGPSAPCWLEFWLSNSSTFARLDAVACESVLLPGLPAGAEFRLGGLSRNLLSTVGDGLYRVGIVVDRPNSLVEVSKANNRSSRADRFLQVGAGSTNVDLRVEGLDFPSRSVSAGDRVELSGRIVNRGAQMSRSVWVEIWVSSHPTAATLDHLFCESTMIGPLGPGETFELATLNRLVYGPAQGLHKGRFRLGVFADRPAEQADTNRTNNRVFRLDKWLNVGGVAGARRWQSYR